MKVLESEYLNKNSNRKIESLKKDESISWRIIKNESKSGIKVGLKTRILSMF